MADSYTKAVFRAVVGVISAIVGYQIVDSLIVGSFTRDAEVAGSTSLTLVGGAVGTLFLTAVPVAFGLLAFYAAFKVLGSASGGRE